MAKAAFYDTKKNLANKINNLTVLHRKISYFKDLSRFLSPENHIYFWLDA